MHGFHRRGRYSTTVRPVPHRGTQPRRAGGARTPRCHRRPRRRPGRFSHRHRRRRNVGAFDGPVGQARRSALHHRRGQRRRRRHVVRQPVPGESASIRPTTSTAIRSKTSTRGRSCIRPATSSTAISPASPTPTAFAITSASTLVSKRRRGTPPPRSGGGDTLVARAVVSAVGQLNRPKYPNLPGVGSFAGPAFHSARWDHDVDLAGKRVAVIGTGASAF